jgi:hypothetical protein
MTTPSTATAFRELLEKHPPSWHAEPCAFCNRLGGRVDTGPLWNVVDANNRTVVGDLPEPLARSIAALPGLIDALGDAIAFCDHVVVDGMGDDERGELAARVESWEAALDAATGRGDE